MVKQQELSDVQLVILSAASNHKNESILPHSASMKTFGVRLERAIADLVERKFIQRDNAAFNEQSLRDEKGVHTFRITAAGYLAIGIDQESIMGDDKHEAEKAKGNKHKEDVAGKVKEVSGKVAEAAEKMKAEGGGKAPKTPKAPKEPKAEGAGRKSATYGANKLWPRCTAYAGRPKSVREECFIIVRNHPGIPYADYTKAGGNPFDLGFLIDRGYISTEEVKPVPTWDEVSSEYKINAPAPKAPKPPKEPKPKKEKAAKASPEAAKSEGAAAEGAAKPEGGAEAA